MKRTVSATSRAKPISCVTMTSVVPERASSLITSSTSLTSSGSSADVGSSNNSTFGFSASARAIATRCCCPPESWRGYACAFAARPTRASSSRASRSASARVARPDATGASTMFSSTVRCANRLKFWNTMPTSARRRSTSFSFSSYSVSPSRR
ncbi:conserved hypothetical protein [Burkholderia pseudomallei 1710b]|uniref:Uncharacterized protein n=1 Tax=Burkholderia pseudomallei (strain 1710b) TaxID=320372 RepID=Q3JKK7_BURP1|nr:conserved hypothetical protein [Burkholderia pseudomallei 1710b]